MFECNDQKSFFANFVYRSNYLIVRLCLSVIALSAPAYADNDLLDEVPLLETIQFELLGTDCSGRLQVTVKAYEMCQSQNGNVTLTDDIKIVVLNNKVDQEEGPIYVQANKLLYNKEQSLCIVTGNVLVTVPEKQLTIRTEQLSYDMKQEIIFTDLPIVIAHKSHELKGIGLRATRNLTQYTITTPNGTVEIDQAPILKD
ncbi:LPS export ABC transporter periplasmic protein LptC [Candidatus Cardinium hertigii]|uniref:LPS export ABC transporter periplasmic protein LptC n=1 Tax=Candidatus Cardinium hertigii TaxID=247481 RepID=UPI003D7C5D0F